MLLASNLASLVDESSLVDEKKPMNRLELKRFLELRIKRRVKDQFKDGKFHDLIEKVIANPYTLQDAYDSVRVNSKVNLASECDNINFHCLAEELASGKFDIKANIYSISTRGANKEKLVLPNLKMNVIQEAIRIALEVVYRPHFSKISHGCRSGRGQSSAMKYICKEIINPDWWFPLVLNKKIDTCILSKLISTMESKIEDPRLYSIIQSMFHAGILNLEFGGFAKGHGLPQEGVLSPILMNIYLDLFDREILNLSMKYEVLDTPDSSQCDESKSKSKLRSWFRRQMGATQRNEGNMSGVRVHCCRLMDEILIVVKGSKEVSLALKSEIETYMQGALYLDIDSKTNILPCNDPRGVKFMGKIIKRTVKESPAVRAVHKLKEKVELFALQKEEAWDEGTVRIGKKVLGHGYKKVKESEIKHLADCNSVLSRVSRFRKPGMETDHWYKVLLKVWMQDTNLKKHDTEEYILSKFITEKALPQDLKDSFYTFQNHAKRYVSSETKSTVTLLPESSISSESVYITEIVSPLKAIRLCLQRYGITNHEGYPRACHMLVLLDHDHIIDWFHVMASNLEEQERNWLDLPSDVTINILNRIGIVDILENAQKVCTAWYKLCKDPVLWRVLNMNDLLSSHPTLPIQTMFKEAVDRSQGQLVDITIVYDWNAQLFLYAADRSSQLKRLEIASCFNFEYGYLTTYALMKFPLLEELNFYSLDISEKGIETFGRYSPMIKTLRVNEKVPRDWVSGTTTNEGRLNAIAVAIGQNFAELRHLELIGNGMTNNGLQMILDNCHHLETLDLRACDNIDLKGYLGEKCSKQIKNLKLPNDSLEGCPYYDEIVSELAHDDDYYYYDPDLEYYDCFEPDDYY
ncbi:hypothetical protein SSX86_013231 [Deinandra increscens subsp. villosa]|uniref:F-box domain-containing protein n=1 Tax=Deinandra increscens subsp. villosa TaxID=3103831 RepID=A0AAP0D5P0_9ASTR